MGPGRPQIERDQPGAFGAYRLRGFAIGDSCLFHVRGGELVRSFPLETAAQFQADPIVLGSIDLKRDHLMQFTMLNELCYPDDLLVLCTDALAEWAMQAARGGRRRPTGTAAATMPEADWQAQIAELRQPRHIRYDDTTLVLLRVLAPTPGTTGARDTGPAAAAASGTSRNCRKRPKRSPGKWSTKLTKYPSGWPAAS